MKFVDVKRLPPELQPMALEMGNLDKKVDAYIQHVQNLADDVTVLRALIQQFMKMVEEKPGEENDVQGTERDGAERAGDVPEGQRGGAAVDASAGGEMPLREPVVGEDPGRGVGRG